jgi:hypothetical protein
MASGTAPLADAGVAAMAAVATPVVAAVEAAALTAATIATNIVAAASLGTNILGGGSPSESTPAEPASPPEGEDKGSGENDLA